MPDPITWSELVKAIGDLTTIEEDIDAKILTHNFDASAHGQSDEAVYNHRIASLMDHVNYSIYNIKMNPNTRPIKAFVDVGGAAEFSTIQDAIAYVHALSGGKIALGDGNYIQNNDITLFSDIGIEGEDDDTTIIDFNDTTYRMKGEGTAGTHLKNIRLSHFGIARSANNTYEALRLYYADDCKIEDCKFYENIAADADGTGDLRLEEVTRIHVERNRFSSAVNIQLKGDSIYINNNYFDGAPRGGLEGNCIYMPYACHSVRITNNHFDATLQSAIYIQNNYGASSQILVLGNFFSGADTWMIYADPVEGMTIVGNVFDNSGIGGGDAINLQGCSFVTICGNDIASFANDGVHLNGSDHVTITGNAINNCDGWGVNIADAACDNTIVVGNGMAGNSSGNVQDLGTGTINQHNG